MAMPVVEGSVSPTACEIRAALEQIAASESVRRVVQAHGGSQTARNLLEVLQQLEQHAREDLAELDRLGAS